MLLNTHRNNNLVSYSVHTEHRAAALIFKDPVYILNVMFAVKINLENRSSDHERTVQ